MERNIFDLHQRVAVITGGASGLGLEMAKVLAAHGARAFILDRDIKPLAQKANDLRSAGQEIEREVVDVTDTHQLRHSFQRIVDHCGQLDIVVVNAGISGGPGPSDSSGAIEAVSRAVWDRVLAVNLTAAFETLQCAALHMKRRRRGRIIVTCSAAGMRSEQAVSYAYAASKAALIQIVRQAAVELAPHSVLVNAIAPGPFATAIGGGALNDPALQKVLRRRIPLGRIANPEEIQGLVLLLASDASSYITGAVFPIDGGFLA